MTSLRLPEKVLKLINNKPNLEIIAEKIKS